MRFRRAIVAAAAILAATPLAAAQDARKIQIAYEITFAGITGFRIDVTARFNGASYDVETSTYKEGMLKAITMNYIGRNRAWGGFSTRGAQPAAGSLSISVDGKPRTWLAQYGASGFLQETHTPVWKPTPQQTISEADRQGSLDPLTAALSVGLAGDAACDRTVRSNDGKRRIDVILHKVGMEPAASTGIPGARGDVLVCDIYTKRISGEFEEAPKEAETDRERPVRIWLARFDDTPIRYPGKLEAHTFFATIRGRILSFQESPLTPEEIRGMRR
ncbi:DUF3108 domain-containing protein [Reyranella sp.]|uniref:DUF3108 domain-containing protein n=1 Tax=Reyranella sp. TaxID=1929291 RepID=UPI003BAAA383